MLCPNCQAPMEAETLAGYAGTSIAIDVCRPCHLFWFDARESLRLAPAGVLRLFGLIGDEALERSTPQSAVTRCPVCSLRLVLTHDRQRNTRFHYLNCPQGHGRLISYVQFLREKNYIRPMTRQQVAELRNSVRTVNCGNCGAPVDLATHTICGHCRSPLSMLDLEGAGEVVAQLRAAAVPGEIDPTLPLRLAEARREVEKAFAGFRNSPQWLHDVSIAGPLGAGLKALARWLSRREM